MGCDEPGAAAAAAPALACALLPSAGARADGNCVKNDSPNCAAEDAAAGRVVPPYAGGSRESSSAVKGRDSRMAGEGGEDKSLLSELDSSWLI